MSIEKARFSESGRGDLLCAENDELRQVVGATTGVATFFVFTPAIKHLLRAQSRSGIRPEINPQTSWCFLIGKCIRAGANIKGLWHLL
ncbi:MAG: hypothetical protein WCT32_00930 [Patescibacteria group bacterium]